MILKFPSIFILSLALCAPLQAQDSSEKKPAAEAKSEAALPADVLNYYGKISGTVESVDAAKSEMKVKVSTATADAAKNKAPKPETLAGMVITVTPLEKKDKDGKKSLDAASVAFIGGAKAGDPVTLDVRASSKGVVFRLLKVPSAAGK